MIVAFFQILLNRPYLLMNAAVGSSIYALQNMNQWEFLALKINLDHNGAVNIAKKKQPTPKIATRMNYFVAPDCLSQAANNESGK